MIGRPTNASGCGRPEASGNAALHVPASVILFSITFSPFVIFGLRIIIMIVNISQNTHTH